MLRKCDFDQTAANLSQFGSSVNVNLPPAFARRFAAEVYLWARHVIREHFCNSAYLFLLFAPASIHGVFRMSFNWASVADRVEFVDFEFKLAFAIQMRQERIELPTLGL